MMFYPLKMKLLKGIEDTYFKSILARAPKRLFKVKVELNLSTDKMKKDC